MKDTNQPLLFCSQEWRNDGRIIREFGYNNDGSIINSLMKKEVGRFTEFSIKDGKGHQLTPNFVVCCFNCTLNMFSKNSRIGKQLVFFDIKGSNSVFLDI